MADSFLKNIGSQLLGGYGEFAKSVGSAIEFADPDWLGRSLGYRNAEELADRVKSYWGRVVDENPPPKGNLYDDPGLALDPQWLLGNVARMAPFSLATFPAGIGAARLAGSLGAGLFGRAAATGAGVLPASFLESMEVYETAREKGLDNPRERALAATAGIAALNVAPVSAMLSKMPWLKKGIATSLSEGLTEYLEEPVQAALMDESVTDALKYGLNVIPPAMLLGGAVSYAGRKLDQNVRLSEPEVARRALAFLDQNGGATVSMTGDSMAHRPGFAVGMFPTRARTIEERPVTVGDIRLFMRDNKDLLNEPGNMIGLWKDNESGKTFLDITRIFKNRDDAIRVGSAIGELAVFDLGNMEEIRLNYAPEQLANLSLTSKTLGIPGIQAQVRAPDVRFENNVMTVTEGKSSVAARIRGTEAGIPDHAIAQDELREDAPERIVTRLLEELADRGVTRVKVSNKAVQEPRIAAALQRLSNIGSISNPVPMPNGFITMLKARPQEATSQRAARARQENAYAGQIGPSAWSYTSGPDNVMDSYFKRIKPLFEFQRHVEVSETPMGPIYSETKPPTQKQALVMSAALQDLERAGLPVAKLGLNNIGVAHFSEPDTNGVYQAQKKAVFISEDLAETLLESRDQAMENVFRVYLAHEVSHHIDINPRIGYTRSGLDDAMSAHSPLFNLPGPGKLSGEVMQEAIDTFFNSGNESLHNFLMYPLFRLQELSKLSQLKNEAAMIGDVHSARMIAQQEDFVRKWIQVETFAQISSLYWVYPQFMAETMPVSTRFMRGVEDALQRSDAVERYQQLLTVFRASDSAALRSAEQSRLFAQTADRGAGKGRARPGAGQQGPRAGQRGRTAPGEVAAGIPKEGQGGIPEGDSLYMMGLETLRRDNNQSAADSLIADLVQDIDALNEKAYEEWYEEVTRKADIETTDVDMLVDESFTDVSTDFVKRASDQEAFKYLTQHESIDDALDSIETDIEEARTEAEAFELTGEQKDGPDLVGIQTTLKDWKERGYTFVPEGSTIGIDVGGFEREGIDAIRFVNEHEELTDRHGEIDLGSLIDFLVSEEEIEGPPYYDYDYLRSEYESTVDQLLRNSWDLEDISSEYGARFTRDADAIYHTPAGDVSAEVYDEATEEYETVYEGGYFSEAEQAIEEWHEEKRQNYFRRMPRPPKAWAKAIRGAKRVKPLLDVLRGYESLDPVTIQVAAAVRDVGPLSEAEQAAVWQSVENTYSFPNLGNIFPNEDGSAFALVEDTDLIWRSEDRVLLELANKIKYFSEPENINRQRYGAYLPNLPSEEADTWEKAKKIIDELAKVRPATTENANKIRKLITKFFPKENIKQDRILNQIKVIMRTQGVGDTPTERGRAKAELIRRMLVDVLGPKSGLSPVIEPIDDDTRWKLDEDRRMALAGEQQKLQARLDQKLKETSIWKPDERGLKGDPSTLDASTKLRKAIQELSGKPSYENAQKIRELMAAYPPGINFLPSQTVHERVQEVRRKIQPWTSESARRYDPAEITTPMETLADRLGTSPEEVQKFLKRKLGKAYNSEQIEQAARIVVQESNRISSTLDDLLRKFNDATLSDADIATLYEIELEATELLAQYMGVRAEAGRALNAFRKIKSVTERVQKVLDAKSRDQMLVELQLMRDMTTGERVRFAGGLHEITKWDMLLEYYINSLISGPQTHVVNFASNSIMQVFEGAARFVAAATNKDVTFKDAWRYATTFWGEFPRALMQARRYVLNEDAVAQIVQGMERDMAGKIERETLRPRAIPGRLGKIIRTPGRVLGAADMAFKIAITRAELKARTMKAGIPLDQATDEMKNAAWKIAEKLTFTEDLGEWGKAISRVANQHPLFRMIVAPFIRTPWNIAKFAVTQGSPLGLLTNEYKLASREERAIMRGRMILGSSLAITAFMLAQAGLMTGGPPEDPREREHWYRLNQPYSIKIGDTWVAFSRFEPLGMLMGTAGDFAVLMSRMTDMEASEIIQNVFASIYRNLASKTFLRGFFDAISAINDPVRYGETYLERLSGGIVPVALAQVARTEDPYLRRVDSIFDAIRARIPGQREKLPLRLDVYGRPIRMEGGIGPDLISPAYQKRIVRDPVIEELLRHDYFPGRAPEKFRRGGVGVDLSPQEHQQLIRATGDPLYRVLSVMVNSPEYQRLSPWARREALQRITERVRAAGRQYWLANNPQVIMRWIKEAIEQSRRFNAA